MHYSYPFECKMILVFTVYVLSPAFGACLDFSKTTQSVINFRVSLNDRKSFHNTNCPTFISGMKRASKIYSRFLMEFLIADKYKDYKDIVTGIVIVSASEPVELLFGCWSDFKDSGGAGHVTIKNDWKDIQIKPVVDKKGTIIAATMIAIDDCDISTSGAPRSSVAIANFLLFFAFQTLCFLCY